MKIDFDPAKNLKNIAERGLSFEQVIDFDFETAILTEDTRKNYGETRMQALGFIGQRLYILVFTRIADGIRVISFRKANPREVKHYGNQNHN